jgi:RND family efflux transporter MFP subunit
VVTARNVQVGQLVTANLSTGTELFHIAETDVLRVFVSVPQSYVRSVREGLGVDVTVPEYPGRAFTGTIARYAGALDSASRTLLVEIHLPNSKGELFAGMFGQARFSIPSSQSTIVLPSNAAIFNAAGTQVAIVDESSRIRLVPVKFGRDFGTQIEIVDGLKAGAHVVANPSDALTDGLEVTPVLQEAAPKK